MAGRTLGTEDGGEVALAVELDLVEIVRRRHRTPDDMSPGLIMSNPCWVISTKRVVRNPEMRYTPAGSTSQVEYT